MSQPNETSARSLAGDRRGAVSELTQTDGGPSDGASKPPINGGVVTPRPLTWRRKLAAVAVYWLTRALTCTLRVRWDDRSGLFQGQSGPIIFALWHNRLALSMVVYHGYVRRKRPTAGLAAMISASRDGGLLSAVLKKYQVQPVRGSSSRRGRQALLETVGLIEDGYHAAITPDGPRGPSYRVQEGVISLAKLTGASIVPVSTEVRWKICLGSWDRFQIPLPFARCHVRLGGPIHVPREASDADRKALQERLRGELMNLTTD